MDSATQAYVRERACNRCEYCCLPQFAASFLTFHVEHVLAKQHIWDEHFEFRGAIIVGRTSVGQATIDLLQMNADDRVEMRSELQSNGEM